MKKRILLFLQFLLTIPVFAQETIVTDRPDVTESAITVPLSTFQLETGFVIENSQDEDAGAIINIKDISVLSSLLRYGLMESIELRFGAEYLYQRVNSAGTQTLEGLSGIELGTKIQLVRDQVSVPDLALLAHIGLPVGSDNFSPDKIEPQIILAASHDLNDQFGLAYNLGGSWNSAAEQAALLYSVSLAASLSEKIGAFIEIFGNAEKGTEPGKNLDGGITYLLQDNFQLDLSGGISFDEPQNNWFITTGISFRLPE